MRSWQKRDRRLGDTNVAHFVRYRYISYLNIPYVRFSVVQARGEEEKYLAG